MKKPFGYTPYGPVTAVCLNVKLHASVNAVEELSIFNLINLRSLPTLNNLSRIEGCLEHPQFNLFRTTLEQLKLRSKIAFLQDDLNKSNRTARRQARQSLDVPRVVGHINLDRDPLDDDLPF